MNTLPNIYELFHFNLTVSPLYLVKLKITQKQLIAYAVYSVEPIVPDFCKKSFNVRFFPYLLENSFGSLLSFSKKLSSNSIWVILTCKLKLNCRDL